MECPVALGEELRERLVGDQSPVVDDHHVVDGLSDLGEHVAGEQDGATLVRQTAQEVTQPPDALGVQAVGGFVEHEDPWVVDQRRGQPEPLLHPQGEAAHAPVRRSGQLDHVEQLRRP